MQLSMQSSSQKMEASIAGRVDQKRSGMIQIRYGDIYIYIYNSCTHAQLTRVYTCSIFFSETNWDILQTIYQHPRHIDLFVGGLAEDQIDGGQVGQVFANIIAMQFKNLMDGDRYQNVLSVYFVAQKNISS